ncbi:pyridine nucleotide-disulfide oxidoreductase [Bifidobacterium sp. DSM 109958]|uniref:Pyridine nucleotide-disulfide oxidoreductase n=1 Tax=Bifidobacterium moraviense TaxID=2675323 RepID=A0A7Y0F2P1_9BIFI|nr:FAD-dependent oxidoreductase [Bifidobacterium sp. DSM 109958]NMN00930.1 pyridine nucleotide-disulfide oxidoreductase [Bifidobacterium sp. DSM 109958]
MTTVAVIGCTHAGTFAAQSILREHPDWTVHVFERNDTLSFLSCGIALWVGDNVSDPAKMFYSSPETLGNFGATMHMRTDVLSVDVAAKTLRAKDLETGEETDYSFDKLVVTTGSKPVVPPIPGIDSDRVMLCKNWEHGQAIKRRARNAKSVVVVGAGYIGAELAEQLSLAGVKVTLVDAAERVLANNFDGAITAQVEKAFISHGVRLALDQKATAFEETEDGIAVVTDKGRYEGDFAILAIGFLPATDLLSGQVDMLPNGAIVVDEYMRASVPDVFAAGDAATVFFNPSGRYDYIPLATNAVRQGLLVGRNIEKATRAYMGTQATSAVQLYDLSLAASGLTFEGARRRCIELCQTELTENYRPDFMVSTTPVTCILTWDPVTFEVKGGQFLSKADISGAANVVSMAIQSHYTVEDLANVDFLFQPNFDKPIYYVGAVAMKAASQARKA